MSDEHVNLSPADFEYGPGYLEGLTKEKRAKRDDEIKWHDWGNMPFDKAKAEDKLVLLDITAPWCHWCHVMDETTYSTPAVIDFINKNFIAVRVHADRHPEVEKAYLSGGWPTTALLLPGGETLSSLTYVPPENMLKWMSEVLRVYGEQKDDIEGQVAAQRAGFMAQLETAKPDDGALPDIESLALRLTGDALRAFDGEYGGFGSPEHGFQPKFPQPALMEFFLSRVHDVGDPSANQMLNATLMAQRGILDPVWGGFFRYSVNRVWTVPHFEKMLGDQARIFRNYLHYFLHTGEDWAKEVCSEIARYVDDWLRGSDWEFFSSQDADVGSHEAGSAFIPGEDYFELPDIERRKLGIPFVETDVIASWAADMAGTYIEFGAATGDSDRLAFGIKALEGIWSNMRSPDGWIRRSLERTVQDFPSLPDQVSFGRAALIAHGATGGEIWIERAVEIAGIIENRFEDKNGGGFFFVPFIGKHRGNLLFIGKPFEENAEAAAFFAELHLATAQEKFAESAKRALISAAPSADKYGFLGSAYFHALYLCISGSSFAYVNPGTAKGPASRELNSVSVSTDIFGIYQPGRVVRHLYAEGTKVDFGGVSFDAAGSSKLYFCKGKTCSSPIDFDNLSSGTELRNKIGDLTKLK